ncbi:MAG: PAS domain S-box protein [Leptolyngbyaceae cyanobacterium]
MNIWLVAVTLSWMSPSWALGFMPDDHCYLGQPRFIGVHWVSDLLVVVACYSISVMLLYFWRKQWPNAEELQQINEALQQEIEHRRQAEEQLQLFVRHTPAAIAMLDRDVRYVLHSDRWLQDYGLESQDIIGRSHYEVFPEIPERWKQDHQDCLRGEVLSCDEDSFERLDGTTEWLRWELYPWYTSHDEIGGLIMFTEVTTERHRMQRELQMANERLETEVQFRTRELRHVNQQMQFHLNNTPLAMIEWTADRRVKRWSHQAEAIFGWSEEEMMGRSLTDPDWVFVHEADAIAVAEVGAALRQQKIPRNFSANRNYAKNGDVIDCEWYNSVLFDEAGQLVSILSFVKDVSRRHRSERELRLSEERFRSTFEQAAVGLAHLSLDGQWLRVNQRLCDILGYERSDLLKHQFQAIIHPDDSVIDADYVEQILTQKIDYYSIEKRYIRSDHSYVWVNLTVSLTWRPSSKGGATSSSDIPDYFIVVMEDISDRKRMEAELFQEKEFAEITLNSIGDGILTTDASGQITYLNPTGEQLLGWHHQDIMGQPAADVLNRVHEVTREAVICPIQQVLQAEKTVGWGNHTLLIAKDGQEYPIEDSVAPIFDRDGELVGSVLIFRDVSQSRELSRQLSWQARHDGLTHLINRWGFEQELTRIITSLPDEDQCHSLCYLDLDQFKIVNDTCGHGAGDELLRQVAQLLHQHIRASDILARLGGDEFGILLQGCVIDNAEAIAEKIRQQIQEFRFIWDEKSFAIGVSIGIVSISSDNDELQNLATVLSAADAACYAAKDAGRNRIHVYQVNDNVLSQQRSERQWTVKIRHALEQNRFQLHYQQVVPADPHDSQLGNHYEVLIRMVDENGTLIPPMAFIPAAERYDLMPDIDQWVVQTTFECYDQLIAQIMATSTSAMVPKLMINLSGNSLCDQRFLNYVIDWFETEQIPPSLICFEITETAAIANLSQATEFIRILKTYGCQFALDDFGSGMSSFAYLKNLPVDYLKIDGNFVRDILDDPVDCTIVRFINSLSQTLGMKTIAEFVENQQVRDRLQEIGVNYVQGYGIAQPIPFVIS